MPDAGPSPTPRACAVCGSARVTRRVDDRHYCTAHKAEAFEDARRVNIAAHSGGLGPAPPPDWARRRPHQHRVFDMARHYNI